MTDGEFKTEAMSILREKGAADIKIGRGTLDGVPLLDVRCTKNGKEFQLSLVTDGNAATDHAIKEQMLAGLRATDRTHLSDFSIISDRRHQCRWIGEGYGGKPW